jgi:anthranilate phosphoribosyltransferase
VLEALGVPLDVTPLRMARVLREAGIVFMFAPTMHPAMRHVGPVRRELAIPTVMNIVGPLANPALAGRQVLGVADPSRLSLLAGALASLGSVHALVVHGEPGLDEISPLGPSHVLEVRNGVIESWTIDPDAYGIGRVHAQDLAGGAPARNAEIIEELLGGRGNEGAKAAVVLNTAAALYVGGVTETFADGVSRSRDALDAGAGMVALTRLREAYAATA